MDYMTFPLEHFLLKETLDSQHHAWSQMGLGMDCPGTNTSLKGC